MVNPFRLRLHLQFFNDGLEGGGEVAETAPTSVEGDGVASSQGAGTEPQGGGEPSLMEQPEGGEPTDGIDQSKAFAKRLSEKLAQERQAWEAEQQEKYGNYDNLNRMSQFFLQKSGYQSHEQLLEAIEQQELLSRAEQFGVTPEIQKRLEELESKAQRAEELENEKAQAETYRQYRQHLDTFAQGKGMDANELEQFMIDHDVPNFEVAYKALQADKLQAQLETAKQDAIKEYLQSKQAPRVEGSGATGVVSDEPTTDFNVARQRALQRLRAANQQL